MEIKTVNKDLASWVGRLKLADTLAERGKKNLIFIQTSLEKKDLDGAMKGVAMLSFVTKTLEDVFTKEVYTSNDKQEGNHV